MRGKETGGKDEECSCRVMGGLKNEKGRWREGKKPKKERKGEAIYGAGERELYPFPGTTASGVVKQ